MSIELTTDQKIALQSSIEHWDDLQVLFENGRDFEKYAGYENCSLCTLMVLHHCNSSTPGNKRWSCLTDKYWSDIESCPIARYTKQVSCYCTPYALIDDKKLQPKHMSEWLTALLNGEDPEIYE